MPPFARTTLAAAKGPSPKHVLRGILRNLNVKPSPLAKDNGKTNQSVKEYRAHVLGQYRNAKDDPQRRLLAQDYFRLQSDLAERARLYEMDAGADTKFSPMELSRRAAARAGLQLPKLDPELDGR